MSFSISSNQLTQDILTGGNYRQQNQEKAVKLLGHREQEQTIEMIKTASGLQPGARS